MKEQSTVNGTIRRMKAVYDGVRRLASRSPAQALQLLRESGGACRIEFLLQTMPPSPVTAELINVPR